MNKFSIARKIILSSAVSLFCLSDAAAALRSVDLYKAGDQLLTLDEKTGLEWLDLTQSVWTNSVTLTRELQPGGRFFGFNWATKAQVQTLYTDAGWNGEWGKVTSNEGRDVARNLVTQLGATAIFGPAPDDPRWAVGRVSDVYVGPGVTTSMYIQIEFSNPHVPEGDAFYGVSLYTIDSGTPTIGAFLYRQAAPIPEPSMAALLLAGLSAICIAINRRRLKF